PVQTNDEESGSELSEREFEERVREFERYRNQTIQEARQDRRTRRNSNNNQTLENIVEEENEVNQDIEELRNYFREFNVEELENQEQNNEELIPENNNVQTMDLLTFRTRKFK